MRNIIYSFILTLLIISCGNSSKRENDQKNINGLTFGTTEYERKFHNADIPDTELTASIPIAEGNSSAAENINNKIFETLKFFIAQEGDESSNYDELFDGFVRNYENFLINYPDYHVPWEAIVKGTVEYNSPEIINIRIELYTFTGGAHGNSYVNSLLFDPVTGKEFNINDVIKDINSLTRLAEKKFREKYNIPENGSINLTGLMFENDEFTLPHNLFFTKDGLLLFYNTYEIAPYVDGTKEILIPYDEFKNNLIIKIN
ncbi:MAG: DUF3298 and DUF4163 domain-containing protein [Bacteroidales bacterium]|jgi:hypothetical protein|nr:DUF3298 and DUF4163 domain-containing protein [Bacteroidales bacterium]